MATQDEIIAHRRREVRSIVRETMLSVNFQACTRKDNNQTPEGIAYLRQLALVKVALVTDGIALFEHWPVIRQELHEPWDVHMASVNEGAWARVGSQLESRLFLTKKTGFDATELDLYGNNGWLPQEGAGIPGFGIVSNTSVFKFLGLIGGQHPDVDHPRQPLTVSGPRIAVHPGSTISHTISVVGDAEFPLVFRDVTDPPKGWTSVSPDGIITLSPAATLPAQTALMEVEAVDGLGASVTLTIVIDVIAA